ncbi:DUF6328 family protein [Spirillospora sp. CA-142024]|uniref:DUF6328 family protein n=1 Tax=Spirillospora sp. CA-142024 TaxID=3240036 RepID=UPI003D915084
MTIDAARHDGGPIDESPAERTIRNFLELLQGFRVAVTGVQVLFAFLLTVPFAPGYDRLDVAERWLWYVALVAAAVASIFFIAPVAQHRVLFRRGGKEALVRRSNVYGIVGTLALAVTMTASTMVVVGYLFAGPLALITTACLAVLAGWLWFGKPMLTRRQHGPTPGPCCEARGDVVADSGHTDDEPDLWA